MSNKSNNDVSNNNVKVGGNISFESQSQFEQYDQSNLDFDGVTQNNMMEGNFNLN